MAIVGDLITRFTCDMTGLSQGVAQYGRELDKAEKETSDLDKGLDRLASVVTNVTAGVGIATAVIAGFILKATGWADALQDASHATGLSLEQLQRWKAAGRETGVSMDEFSSTARMMTARMGEVADPSSEMSKQLKSIGVSAYDANGKLKDTNTMMWDIIRGLEKQPAGMERSSKALAILGRSWYNIAPMINEAAEAQEAYNNASPFDDKKIKTLHEYQIALDKAGGAMERWAVTIGDKLAPLITGVFVPAVDAVSLAVEHLSLSWDEAQYLMAETFLRGQAIISGNWEQFDAFVTANKQHVVEMEQKEKDLWSGKKSASGEIPNAGNSFLPDITAQDEAIAAAEKKMWDNMADSTKEYKDALQDVMDEKQKLVEMDKDYNREMSQVGWDVSRARDLTIRHGWAEEDQGGKISAAQSELGSAAGNVGKAQLAIAGNLILQINGYNKTIGQAVREGEDLAKKNIVAGINS